MTMDKETMDYLRKLRPTRETMKKMYKEVAPMKADKEKMQEVLASKTASEADKRVIRNALDRAGDMYDKKSLVMDEKVAMEESRRMEIKIKDAIKRGDLKPFDIRKDKQAQKWMKKAQQR